ncbi:Hypothetical Protein FCC1311_005972 [Hondaea fermentalgiana]|uniref:Uncharacterized protein n=1 Tax=Hondaea fermentalgiana TaxID=2315210 RepID=A0A2R5G236_9STRA|nr:Hypothetical Protein FCC1311_005972 [Hondaea fermentalgiana]|eukprot:GBG24379.1 Hypothetical Protein FCC1311_005972 [Hondaea fermentalgiana]
MSATGAGERRKSVVEVAEEEAKASSDHRRKHALERLGVYHPKSKEESQVASLQLEVKELRDALERERALRFRDEQKSKSLQRREEQSLSSELSALSRKLHETRANHQEEMKRVHATAAAEVEEQIDRQRGPVFERLEERMMTLLRSQVNAGEGKLLDLVMEATAGFVEQECAEGPGNPVFRSIRQGVEDKLRNACALRTGSLYESIERDVRGQLAKENAAALAQQAAEAETLEREYHLKLETAIKDMQAKLHGEHTKLRNELSAAMHETGEASLDAFMQMFHHKAEESMEAMLAQSSQTHEAVSARLAEHLEKLASVQDAHATRVRAMVDEGASRLSEALATQRRGDEAREASEKDILSGQITALSQIVQQERDAWHASLESIRGQHEESRKGFEDLFKQERERMETEKTAFEATIRAQYELLASTLREEHAETAKTAMERQVELSAKEALMERTESRMAAEAAQRAEKQAATKWEQTLRDKAAAWKREEEERRVMLQTDLAQRFDTQLRGVEDRLQAAHELRAATEAAWAEEQTRIIDTFAHTETSFKETCERLFHERMDRYVRASEKRLRALQEEILQQAANAAETRAQLELRVEKVRVCGELDKAAYVAEVQKIHERSLADLREQHTAALSELAEELRKARQEIQVLKSAHVLGVQQTMSDRIGDSVELEKLQARLGEEEMRRRAGAQAMQEHRERIISLWGSLKLEASDCESFFLEIFHAAPYSADFEKLLERHLHMLAARIPIAKLLGEREALTQALSQGSWDVRNAPQVRVEKECLLARLGGLNKRLEVELERFRAQFPNEDWARACQKELQTSLRVVPGATLSFAAAHYEPPGQEKRTFLPRSLQWSRSTPQELSFRVTQMDDADLDDASVVEL